MAYVALLFSGCATSGYRIVERQALGTDIEVTSDRVIVECEPITDYEGDRKEPYGFMIHILDLEETVLTVSNGIVLERAACYERMKASEKIIKNGKKVTVRGRGHATAPIHLEPFVYDFPMHGKFPSNGRSLNYLAIWNDRGQCYDAFYGPEKPCPRPP